jgi:hypothetical protein
MNPNDKSDGGEAVRCSAWLDAGSIAPSMKRYRITWAHDHKTLCVGDVVVMTETPRLENMLLREPDMTLHKLQDDHDQYVHMVEASNKA